MKKARKLTSLALALLMLISVFAVAPITASAETFECGDFEYQLLDDGTAEITGHYGSDSDLTIPSELDGYTVTSIGKNAFSGHYDCYPSVIIPGSVKSIGDYAFRSCSGITSLTILDGVKSIGEGAFQQCSNLSSITIPDSVTSIGVSAFSRTNYINDDNNWENNALYIGKHLISIRSDIEGDYVIKSGTLTIADYAFSGHDNLTTVSIPNSITRIPMRAFYGCYNLASVTIPDSVTSIEEYAFYQCKTFQV